MTPISTDFDLRRRRQLALYNAKLVVRPFENKKERKRSKRAERQVVVVVGSKHPVNNRRVISSPVVFMVDNLVVCENRSVLIIKSGELVE